jgi:CpeT protein
MIEKFKELLVGKFDNKRQAFSFPSKFAFIRITHIDIGNNLYYGEQAYNHQLHSPYRQFVLEPIQEENQIRIINYELLDKDQFKNCQNLDKIDRSMLKLKSGCDVVVTKDGNSFKGGLTGCDCYVDWMGRDTYLQNQIELTPDFYYVIDKGFCAKDNHQLWGSKYGRFEFARMPQ